MKISQLVGMLVLFENQHGDKDVVIYDANARGLDYPDLCPVVGVQLRDGAIEILTGTPGDEE